MRQRLADYVVELGCLADMQSLEKLGVPIKGRNIVQRTPPRRPGTIFVRGRIEGKYVYTVDRGMI
jgi:hypothetical protein